VTITGLEAGDFSLSGGFACAIADLGLGFFVGTLNDTLANYIADVDLCGAPGPELFRACPNP